MKMSTILYQDEEYTNVPGSPYFYSEACYESYPCQHDFLKRVDNKFVKFEVDVFGFYETLKKEGYSVPEHFAEYNETFKLENSDEEDQGEG